MGSQHISNSKDKSTGYLPFSEISVTDDIAPMPDKVDYTVLSCGPYYNVQRRSWKGKRWEKSMILVKAIMVGLLVFSVTKVVLSIGIGLWATGWPWGRHQDGNTECGNHTKDFKWANVSSFKCSSILMSICSNKRLCLETVGFIIKLIYSDHPV